MISLFLWIIFGVEDAVAFEGVFPDGIVGCLDGDVPFSGILLDDGVDHIEVFLSLG